MKNLMLTLLICLSSAITSFSAESGVKINAFSPNGKLLASADQTGEITVWDLASGKEMQSLSLRTNNISSLDFTSDGKNLAVSDYFDNYIAFIDLATGKETKRLNVNQISGFRNGTTVFSADGKSLWLIDSLTSFDPAEAWVIDLENNCLKTEKTPKDYSWTANAARTTLAFYSPEDKSIVLLSANTGKEIGRLAVAPEFVDENKKIAMRLSAAGDKLFLYRGFERENKDNKYNNDKFHEIAVISTADGKVLKKASLPVFKRGNTQYDDDPYFDLSTDSGKILLVEKPDSYRSYSAARHLKTLDADALQSVGEFDFPDVDYDSFDLSPDGKTLLTNDTLGKITLWSTATGKQTSVLSASQSPYIRLAASADETKFAAIAANGTIKIWGADGKELIKIKTDLPNVKMLAFNPNGQNLLSIHETSVPGAADDKVETIVRFKIWNAANGKLVREWNNSFYENAVPNEFVVYTKQGDRIIADCARNTSSTVDLCVWNAATGEFSGRSFPVSRRNTVSIFRFGDNQPINVNSPVRKIIEKPEDLEREFLVWDFSTGQLLKQTIDPAEAAQAFGENQIATAIVVNNYEQEKRHQWILRLDGKTALKTIAENLGTDFVHPNQETGAKFTAKELPPPIIDDDAPLAKQDSPSVSPAPSQIFNGASVSLAEPEEIFDEAQIFNLETDEKVSVLQGHANQLTDLIFLRNSSRVITSAYDRTVRVWDAATGRQLLILK